MRGKEVALTAVESAVAVRPTEATRGETRARTVARFGAAALDDSRGGRFGLDLPARSRRLFERAGWLFVEPTRPVASAAGVARETVPTARAVQQVYLDRGGNVQITTDLLTVQLIPGLPATEATRQLAADGLSLVRPLAFAPNTFEVLAPAGQPLVEVVATLQANRARYEFAEPMLLQAITGRGGTGSPIPLPPNDPDYPQQWQHPEIHSEQAWARTRGGSVRLAVIDNGMQINHPDLRDGIVGGGYFQENGIGTTAWVPYQAGMSGFPGGSHGTFCLGMAGARINNERGGCGSAPEGDLMVVACLADQVGTQTTLARAVAYAADPRGEEGQGTKTTGADVIACSLGPNGADWDLTSVMDLALQFAAAQGRGGKGTPIFWAVSNGFFEVARDEVSSHADVTAVGRSNRNDQEDGSAYGPRLEFLAPGRDVYSTRSGSGYGLGTGTSYAAPLAAGVGALVLAQNPDWTALQLRQHLQKSCDQVGGVTYDSQGHHDHYGHGRINAERAVT